MPPQSAYDSIERLVTKFNSLTARQRQAYNEDDTRKDFILPMFRALEWNIDDKAEVAAEEKISRGFVDFSFRINGMRRFVLETKRIGEDLNDPRWAEQAVGYAYHKNVTWAVLSDFEGLKIFNAEAREANPFQAQFREFRVDEYLPRLDELWWLSRSSVLAGVMDREAERVFKKMPRTPIAEALFDNLLEWRKRLYKMLREYNRDKLWTPKDIDDAVQRIFDRLIFTRTAEDRLMEDEKLLGLVRENQHDKILPALKRRFRELDDIYNSQLFRSDFVDTLELGEPSTVVDIIKGLDRSPTEQVRYNFAHIDADVLGRVYEQYLGTVVSEHSEGESKKTKRKSQGIYYTPTFVVKYIVQQTLARYLEENGYNPAHPVRVLDPACGSGSFLIEAFDVIDQYRARTTGDDRGVYDIRDHARQLETLTQCIYGVDKDKQAVEVARLNLLLKALYMREKLPTLENIRCGDSLISGDATELEKYFGAKWQERNPFAWEQQFDKVMAEGGFDVIIGNPPYLLLQPQNIDAGELEFIKNKYSVAQYKIDIFHLFIERGISLLKPGGLLGFITPSTFLTNNYTSNLRRHILDTCEIIKLLVVPDGVFEDASVDNAVIVLRKQRDTGKRHANTISLTRANFDRRNGLIPVETQDISQAEYDDPPTYLFALGKRKGVADFLGKMDTVATPLGDLAQVHFGMQLRDRNKFPKDVVETDSPRKLSKRYKPCITGKDIGRYRKEYNNRYAYFSEEARRGGCWDKEIHFAPEKIVVRQIGEAPISSLDDERYCCLNTVFMIVLKSNGYTHKYILGLLNSMLMGAYWRARFSDYKKTFPKIKGAYLQQLPIRRINFDDPAEKKQHDEMVVLVEEMLRLQKDYAEVARGKFTDKMETLKRRIDAVDNEIDQIVYQLYGLTEDEIRIVEGAVVPA